MPRVQVLPGFPVPEGRYSTCVCCGVPIRLRCARGRPALRCDEHRRENVRLRRRLNRIRAIRGLGSANIAQWAPIESRLHVLAGLS